MPGFLKKTAHRIGTYIRGSHTGIVISLLIGVLLIFALWGRMVFTVAPGHTGVLYRRFEGGTVTNHVYGEGLHVIFPWDRFFIYDTRFQQVTETFDALTRDGLRLNIEVTFRFRPLPDEVGLLHKLVGPNYVNVLIVPDMGARVREQVADKLPEEVYSTKRVDIQDRLLEEMHKLLGVNPEGTVIQRTEFIDLDNVLIREVLLPSTLQEAMIQKNQQLQLMLGYDFRLQRETKEAERKRIEAEGIRDFQNIVKDGITDKYLAWKGIDATLQLSQSPNTKIVIIGNSKNGLPLILGNVDSGASASGVPVLPSQSSAEPSLSLPTPDAMPTSVAPSTGDAQAPAIKTGPNPGAAEPGDKPSADAGSTGHRPDPGVAGTVSSGADPGKGSAPSSSPATGANGKSPVPEPEVVPVMPQGTPSVYTAGSAPAAPKSQP
jgi:prohibitin 2